MNQDTPLSILDRTFANFRRAWRDLARPGTAEPSIGRLRPDLPDADAELVRRQIEVCLSGRGGEVSARSRAAGLGRAYLELSARGRRRFLEILAREQNVDRDRVDAAVAALQAAQDDDERRAAQRDLRAALVPPRVKLFKQFNALPEGIRFLVGLRADLLELVREDRDLADMDRDLKDLLVSWFDVGFLDLARIHWNSPAALLEKLMAYEAVHEIRSWDDLKNRLDSDRRCFAFFHPRMPAEPLIFVEVALVNGIADNIHTLLDEDAPAQDPHQADTAIFYSISNCQRGLAGVSFGNFLIKRVVDDLAGYFRNVRNFATLSPIPGFRRWLEGKLDSDEDLLSASEAQQLMKLTGEERGAAALRAVLDDPAWVDDAARAEALKGPLLRLCARYLLKEKRGDGTAVDRVTHFHMTNGARVERIDWMANRAPAGIKQSAGMMVNYLYKLDEIEANHEKYRGEGNIAAAARVRRLLKS